MQKVFEKYKIGEKLCSKCDIISQYIDINGKCRGVNILKDNKIFTLYTYPSQPLNLPSDNFSNSPVSYEDARILMGDPGYSATRSGVWFSAYDVKESIFVYINSGIPSMLLLKSTPNNITTSPFASNNMFYDRMIELENENDTTNQILNIIWWAYLAEEKNNVGIVTASKWFSTYIRPRDGACKSFCNFSLIQKLKNVNSTIEAIKYLQEKYSSLTEFNFIIVDALIYDDVKCFFIQKAHENEGSKLQLPSYIDKIYTNENSYNQIGSRVFTSKENLESWISSISEESKDIKFTKNLSKVNSRDIGVIKLNTNQMYILQKEINIKFAIYNSYQFQTSGINLYNEMRENTNLEPIKEVNNKTYIYSDNNFFIKNIDVRDSSDNNYGEILVDGNNVYSLLSLKK